MSKYLCLVSLLLAVAIVNSQFDTVLFGSKTRYSDVSKKNIEIKPGFTPSKAFLLIRHATCTSTDHVNIKMRDLLKKKQDEIRIKNIGKEVDKDVQIFLDWDASHHPHAENELIPDGITEMTEFASRLKAKFPTLFGDEYDATKYPIKAMPKDRVKKSAQVFLETVFTSRKFPIEDINTCSEKDLLLMAEYGRTQDPKLSDFENIKKNELKAFKEGKPFTDMRKKFANKFGLDENEVDYEFIQALWENCRWDRLYTGEDRCPCQFFENTHVELMLQVDEDHWWWFASPKVNPFNAELSCGIIDHLLRFLKSNETGPTFPMLFGHRSNILLTHMALGLDEDKATFIKQHSYIMPFIANFLAVVYTNEGSDTFVTFYFNETITFIQLEDGSDCDYCPLSKVVDKLEKYIKDHECEKVASKEKGYYYSLPTY